MISAIIPAKNEGKTIGEVIQGTQPFVDEVIVVVGKDNSDNTEIIARNFNCKVIKDNGKGKGDAMKLGYKQASGDTIVYIDGDASHIPQDIPKLVKPILNDDADLVIASRYLGGSDEFFGNLDKFLRVIGSQIILYGINLRYKTRLTDSQNGFRAIKKKVLEKLGLEENITTIEQEMVMKCLKKGYRVEEIASHEFARKFGHSHIKLSKVWLRYLWCFIKGLF